MRRRGKRLEVSTFPFLAVLLCAMGSLILVLIIMDRKAKLAAHYKAAAAQAQAAEELTKLVAAQKLALQQQQEDARAAWERKRDALHYTLAEQKQALDGQIKKVQDQLIEAAAHLKAELDQSGDLEKRIAAERTRLANEENALATTRETVAQTTAQTAAERNAQTKMTADLLQLEAALQDLKEARERDRQTFSVVPYNGKHGGNRRPLYIECTRDGLVFHPDRQTLPITLNAESARKEVERRVALQREYLTSIKANADGKPYLMLLVRPDGIPSYYYLQGAVRGLDVEFGYEFVDASWILDFSLDGQAGPGQLANAGKTDVAPHPTGHVGAYGGIPGGVGGGSSVPGSGSGAGIMVAGLPTLPSPGPTGANQGGVVGPYMPGSQGGPPGGPGGEGRQPGGSVPGGITGPVGIGAPVGIGRPVGLGGTGSAGGRGPAQDSPDIGSAAGKPGGASVLSVGTGTQPKNPGLPDTGFAAGGNQGGPPGGGMPQGVGSGGNAPPQTVGLGGNGAPPQAAGSGGNAPPQAAGSGGNAPPQVPGSGANASAQGAGQNAGGPPGIPMPQVGTPGSATGQGTSGPGAGNSGNPSAGSTGNAAGTANPSATGTGNSHPATGASQGDPGQPPEKDDTPRFAPPPPAKKQPPPVRVARLHGDRDYLIFIECRPDDVVLYPSRQVFSVQALSRGSPALLQAVQQMIDRKQTQVRPGELPFRPQIRFLVHAESIRSYYTAYPCVGGLDVPMTRQNLDADDDVLSIVTGN